MQDLIEKKLDKIADIWNSFILEYKFCNSKIKYTEDIKSNYFGDILHYFSDTFYIIFKDSTPSNFLENFETSISFLQAIYVQQDFIEELLLIFKCNVLNGDLQLDKNYKINRDIRNELVGHPIRKSKFLDQATNKNKLRLLSSALFSNHFTPGNISYIRYHRDNNYKQESISHAKKDILARHLAFLDRHFDIILNKLGSILKSFYKKIEEIEKVVDNAPFEKVISVVSQSFEFTFHSEPLFKPNLLLEAYVKKDIHIRYSNAIEYFIAGLKTSINETKNTITGFLNKDYLKPFEPAIPPGTPLKIKIQANPKVSVSYHYELSKLSEKRKPIDFNFFASLLREKCREKHEVLRELDFMEINLENDLEYYCSYHHIKNLLGR